MRSYVLLLGIVITALAAGVMTWFHLWNWSAFSELPWWQQLLLGLLVSPWLLLGQAVAEAVLAFACVAIFKVLSLGQIRTSIGANDPQLRFNRVGLARDWDGHWVASEALVMGVGIAAWLVAALLCYRWWPF